MARSFAVETTSTIIRRLDEIAPALTEEIAGNEQAGLLSDRTLQSLRDAEIPSLLTAESLGGLGLFPRDALEVLERLCQIDASIGWIGSNWSSTGLMLPALGPAAAVGGSNVKMADRGCNCERLFRHHRDERSE